jgi:hypothetical protein
MINKERKKSISMLNRVCHHYDSGLQAHARYLMIFSYSGDRPMTEAASTSETSENFCQTTRRNNPEDNLNTHRRENLKSHKSFETSRIVAIVIISSGGPIYRIISKMLTSYLIT